MQNYQIATILLTSSVIAALISAIISAIVSFKLKQTDYRLTYYNKIIEKRMAAYEFIEKQIAMLKTTVMDDDNHFYHLIFGKDAKFYYECQVNLTLAMALNIWVESKTVTCLEKLNDLFLQINHKYNMETDCIKAGKDNYHNVAEIRKELEVLVGRDLLNLYDVKGFIKRKKKLGTRKIYLENNLQNSNKA